MKKSLIKILLRDTAIAWGLFTIAAIVVEYVFPGFLTQWIPLSVGIIITGGCVILYIFIPNK